MSDLLPCPFCGGEAEWKSGGPGSAWVSCKSCPAETGDGAIPRIRDAWNRRALPAVQPDETRAVKLYHIWQSTLNESDYTDEARRKAKAMLVHELISRLETRIVTEGQQP